LTARPVAAGAARLGAAVTGTERTDAAGRLETPSDATGAGAYEPTAGLDRDAG
jgi:hypothetical protein